MRDGEAGPVRLLDAAEAADELGLADHRLTFTSYRALPPGAPEEALAKIYAALQRYASASGGPEKVSLPGCGRSFDARLQLLR